MVIHADISVGQNTLALVQGTHEPVAQQTYTKGKQRYIYVGIYTHEIGVMLNLELCFN